MNINSVLKKTKFFIPVLIVSVLMLAGAVSVYADDDAEIARWSGFRTAAATFTFDDGAPSHYDFAAPLFEKYGYRATFYLVVNWNPNWDEFQKLADNGHEIGSHSNSHPRDMTGEEASSKANIKSHIQSKYCCLTVAYPNCVVPDESAVLQNYIAGRIGNGSWQSFYDVMSKDGPYGPDGPAPWTKVSGILTGSEGTEDFIGNMQSAVDKGGWVAFFTHGFKGKTNGNATYSPTDLNAIEGALKWANQNDKSIWVTPMCCAVMYIKERNASTITKTEESQGVRVYSLTHNIADDVCAYDYPLSIRVPLPSGWKTVNVRQGDVALESKRDGGWIYFDAVPNEGEINVEMTEGTETVKAKNPLKIAAKTKSVKYSKLKKKTQTLKISQVVNFKNKGEGTRSYKRVYAKKGSKSYNKKITINKKTGKVTVRKGLKKGTYKVRIMVKAAGDDSYKAGTKYVTSKIVVK